MTNGTSEPKAWTLTHTILCALGLVILALAGAGYSSIKDSIKEGDVAINKTISVTNDNLMCQIKEIKEQHRDTSNTILKLVTDVARIDANQKARLDRESQNGKGGRP